MYVHMNYEEKELMSRLVENRLREIRSARVAGYREHELEALEQERSSLERLIRQLHESEFDVTA